MAFFRRFSGLMLASVLLFGAAGCGLLSDASPTPDVQEEVGTIAPFGDRTTRFVIQPDADTPLAYVPVDGLPQGFGEVGLRVVFSGNIVPFPDDPAFDANFPLLELTHIALVE